MIANVSQLLSGCAERFPEKIAVELHSGQNITFQQLESETNRFAQYFVECGISRGDRVLTFVKPGFEFVPTIFGLMRIGAVPVVIDPGMKLRRFLKCSAESEAKYLVGFSGAVLLSKLFFAWFRAVKKRIRVPQVVPGIYQRLDAVAIPGGTNDVAAILFTSGSTGIAKGVVCTHKIFSEQARLLREQYNILSDEIDLVVFPLFALFSAAWGITAIIPKMNFARPAITSGKHLYELIHDRGVTHTAGSPAIWKRLVDYCEKNEVKTPTLRRILMAGAQIPEELVVRSGRYARAIHTPYGATEALPISTISSVELQENFEKTRNGAGTCVGRPFPEAEVAIIQPSEQPIEKWDDSLRLGQGKIGEIVVRAGWVTREYFGRDEATRRAKIRSDSGIWHRMGDMGYLDVDGRLWFCGRKDHRIFWGENNFSLPDPVEAIADRHPLVTRSALVGLKTKSGTQSILVIEKKRLSRSQKKTVLDYLHQYDVAKRVSIIATVRRFPVDVRHNIKIDRAKIAKQISWRVKWSLW